MGLTRFELVTPRLSSVCSNQLSYRPSILGISQRTRIAGSLKTRQCARRSTTLLSARSIIEFVASEQTSAAAFAGRDQPFRAAKKL